MCNRNRALSIASTLIKIGNISLTLVTLLERTALIYALIDGKQFDETKRLGHDEQCNAMHGKCHVFPQFFFPHVSRRRRRRRGGAD